MKTLFSLLLKLTVILALLSSAITFRCTSNILAQDARKKIPGTQIPQEQIPGTRKMTEAALAQVAFNQKVPPVERIKGDHVASGISLRNRGGGVINLRGAPPNSEPVKAYLYWDVLANQADSIALVSINGVAVEGILIGQGPDPCWSPANFNFAYRADVPLYLLYNGINGDYKIAGVPSGEGFGMSPWESAPRLPLAEGATLVVFYRNPNSQYNITYIFEAPVSAQMFSGAFSALLTGFIAAPGNTAKFTLVGADGQSGFGLNTSFNISAETSFFQGTQIAGPPAGAPPPSLHADSDWNGEDVEPLNQLWDTRTHIVPIKEESTSAEVKYNSQGDCLVIVAFILGL